MLKFTKIPDYIYLIQVKVKLLVKLLQIGHQLHNLLHLDHLNLIPIKPQFVMLIGHRISCDLLHRQNTLVNHHHHLHIPDYHAGHVDHFQLF